MSDLLKTLSLVAMIAMAPAAFAQSETESDDAPVTQEQAEQPAADGVNDMGLSMGEEVGSEPGTGVGSTYVSEEHGDWQVQCVRAAEGEDPCELFQILSDESGNAVAHISIRGLPDDRQAAAGATIITPLETLLTQQLTLVVDGGKAKRYPYSFCAPIGCYALIGFTNADIAAFKAGAKATLTIAPFVAPDEKVNLTISLSGFTAGYDAVNLANGN